MMVISSCLPGWSLAIFKASEGLFPPAGEATALANFLHDGTPNRSVSYRCANQESIPCPKAFCVSRGLLVSISSSVDASRPRAQPKQRNLAASFITAHLTSYASASPVLSYNK